MQVKWLRGIFSHIKVKFWCHLRTNFKTFNDTFHELFSGFIHNVEKCSILQMACISVPVRYFYHFSVAEFWFLQNLWKYQQFIEQTEDLTVRKVSCLIWVSSSSLTLISCCISLAKDNLHWKCLGFCGVLCSGCSFRIRSDECTFQGNISVTAVNKKLGPRQETKRDGYKLADR